MAQGFNPRPDFRGGHSGNAPRQGGGHSSNPAEADIQVTNFDFTTAGVKAKPGLFSDEAEKWAKIVSRYGEDERGNKNKSTQLRNFYNELVMWEERCAGTVAKLDELLPYIYMMKAKAAYAKGRENIDQKFLAFFTGIINGIRQGDLDTLKNAKLFFEAFMGYYKQYHPKD